MSWEGTVRRLLEGEFREGLEVKQAFLQTCLGQVVQVAQATCQCLRDGGKVLLFGNGGSAADAQHIAAEFVNRYGRERKALPAIALTTDVSILTSVANDRDYAEVFARQIEALGRQGDIVYALSTSGNSPNVLRGVEVAKAQGMVCVGFTGGDGGKLAKLVDYPLIIPSRSTPRIQEVHITIGHALCLVVEMALGGEL